MRGFEGKEERKTNVLHCDERKGLEGRAELLLGSFLCNTFKFTLKKKTKLNVQIDENEVGKRQRKSKAQREMELKRINSVY